MKRFLKWYYICGLCAVLLVVLLLVINPFGVAEYQNKVKNTVITNVDLSDIPDGVYVGEYDVTYIYAKVQVTVQAKKIADITILEHKNERGAPAESITRAIIDQQRIEVDTISGATNSSIVIQKAVENALTG